MSQEKATPLGAVGVKSKDSRAPGLRSMTGYAQAVADQDGWALRLSVRSVNHRFLDLHVRLPEGYEAIEPKIRQISRDSRDGQRLLSFPAQLHGRQVAHQGA